MAVGHNNGCAYQMRYQHRNARELCTRRRVLAKAFGLPAGLRTYPNNPPPLRAGVTRF